MDCIAISKYIPTYNLCVNNILDNIMYDKDNCNGIDLKSIYCNILKQYLTLGHDFGLIMAIYTLKVLQIIIFHWVQKDKDI